MVVDGDVELHSQNLGECVLTDESSSVGKFWSQKNFKNYSEGYHGKSRLPASYYDELLGIALVYCDI